LWHDSPAISRARNIPETKSWRRTQLLHKPRHRRHACRRILGEVSAGFCGKLSKYRKGIVDPRRLACPEAAEGNRRPLPKTRTLHKQREGCATPTHVSVANALRLPESRFAASIFAGSVPSRRRQARGGSNQSPRPPVPGRRRVIACVFRQTAVKIAGGTNIVSPCLFTLQDV
jgi:hypothetical protein